MSNTPFIPRNAEGVPLTEEEVDAELERAQQRLTSQLQIIDDSYVKSNQLIESRMLPALEKFAQATKEIGERMNPWLRFFELMKNSPSYNISDNTSVTTYSTNRPPLDDHTFRSDQVNWRITPHDAQQARSNQQPTPATTMQQESFLKPSPASTTSSIHAGGGRNSSAAAIAYSPPRAVPERLDPNDLLGTPQREAAQMLTENVLRSVGIQSSSDSDSTGDAFKRPAPRPPRASLIQHQQRSTSEKTTPKRGKVIRAWEISDMDVDDPISRKKAEQFLEKQQNKFKKMPDDFELPSIRQAAKSPSSQRYYQGSYMIGAVDDEQEEEEEEEVLANTPTIQRVLNTKEQDLRHSSGLVIDSPTTRKRVRDEWTSNSYSSGMSNVRKNLTDGGTRRARVVQELGQVEIDLVEETAGELSEVGFKTPTQFMHLSSPQVQQQQAEESESETGAYLFSDTLPPPTYQIQQEQDVRSQSMATTTTNSSIHEEQQRTGSIYNNNNNNNMTMKTGQFTNTVVPAQFSLKYFAPTFQTPPASTQLTKIWHVFDSKPGIMLTVKDIVNEINEKGYDEDTIKLFIEILSTKKFIKKVGDHHAWVVRR